jgi:tetratricopeptide (TPR) repeat protein
MEKQNHFNQTVIFRTLLAVILSILIAPLGVKAQTRYTQEIYNAYISGDMQEWKSLIKEMDREKTTEGHPEFLYELGLLKYGYIAYCIDHERKDEAKEYIESVLSDIEDMLSMDPGYAEAYALWGAIYGFRIQLNPVSAIYLGPRSMDKIEKSIELDPESAAGWLEMANSEFYRPSMFGGDKEKAIETYGKAIRLFETEKDVMENNWHYLNTLIALANAYEETGQPNKAILQYEKILSIAPDFAWVRDELYPNVIRENQY